MGIKKMRQQNITCIFIILLFFLSCSKLFDPEYAINKYVQEAQLQVNQYCTLLKSGKNNLSLQLLEKYFLNNYAVFFQEHFVKRGPIVDYEFKNASHEIFYSAKNNTTITTIAIYLHYELTFQRGKQNYVFVLTRDDLPNEQFKIDAIHIHNPGQTLIGKY